MARFDLTDFEWDVIQPLLPTKVRGVKRVDDRKVLNGIFWRLRTGAPWADIPARLPRFSRESFCLRVEYCALEPLNIGAQAYRPMGRRDDIRLPRFGWAAFPD